jgi:hypothetical protein
MSSINPRIKELSIDCSAPGILAEGNHESLFDSLELADKEISNKQIRGLGALILVSVI